MASYVFDIEANGLLVSCTKLHCVVLKELDSKEVFKFRPKEDGWAYRLEEAEITTGHNVVGYDLPALKKLTGFKLPDSVRVHDTAILSKVLNYRRFGYRPHSLKVWGEHLGFPKIDFNEFEEFSEEMLTYCVGDVELNYLVYYALVDELQRALTTKKGEYLKTYIKAEHATAEWCAEAELNGWPFDVEGALALKEELDEKIAVSTKALEPKLGLKIIAVDKVKGVVPPKSPKWTKEGFYYAHTANWFDIDPCEGHPSMSRPIEGDYCRIEVEPVKLSSLTDMKVWLNSVGWEPTEFNYKQTRVNGRFEMIPMSPKITEESLEFLGGDGKLYHEFLMVSARVSIVNTWLESFDENGNLHGSCNTIGTPSMRATHKTIVNVPSLDSAYGAEMRSLFRSKEGWRIVGCDSKGNQARGLAHYLGNKEYTDILLEGDIHQYNADKLTDALHSLNYTVDVLMEKGLPEGRVPRSAAKRVFYALLFGASGAKLWLYIFKEVNAEKGNKLKNAFLREVPGFDGLIKSLNKTFSVTVARGHGYIPSVVGSRVYVDSRHKLLVYLLQSCEKITCATAVMLAMEQFKKEGIPYIPLIFMHDEFQVMVPEEHAERVAKIGAWAFKRGPELYGINIMDGDSNIGNTWKETH